jgi:hypothetical protein
MNYTFRIKDSEIKEVRKRREKNRGVEKGGRRSLVRKNSQTIPHTANMI